MSLKKRARDGSGPLARCRAWGLNPDLNGHGARVFKLQREGKSVPVSQGFAQTHQVEPVGTGMAQG